MNFIDALKITEGVMEQYRQKHPKWWKRMDGTPILNDLPVLMAQAFVDDEEAKRVAALPRCMKKPKEPCDCLSYCGDDRHWSQGGGKQERTR